jgi:ribose transport system ATP-binding protein
MKPSLQAVNISKSFPGVKALTNVSVDFYPGEVHALIGENGAGKSTLIKIMSGIYFPDEGYITLDGERVSFSNPREAIDRGVAVIHQELSIANDLTVAENIFLGIEPRKGALLDRALMNRVSQEILDFMQVDIKATTVARYLSAAQQQMVEIAKVINKDAKVVIMDEPTSSLSEHEINALVTQIRRLKENNVTILYISHRMVEIFEFCDRATVLRDGALVCTKIVAETTEGELVESMVGREIKDFYRRKDHSKGEEVLRVEGLSREGEFSDISFSAYAGEILGISGLVGAGRTEVMETIFGERKPDAGKIFIHGEELKVADPKISISKQIGLVTEDRRRTGLMLRATVKHNMVLPSVSKMKKKFGFIDFKWEDQVSKDMIKKLNIRTPSTETVIANLSGGNQQKVILARWLVAGSDILILDEPTRGIDVNAKSEFYALMNDFVDNGGCIIMVSSEMPEIIGVADRIIVMREGKISGELSADEATEQAIIRLASLGSVS